MSAIKVLRVSALLFAVAAPVLAAGCATSYPGGPGNNPYEGRFYDHKDNYTNWDTGTTYPGAPGETHE